MRASAATRAPARSFRSRVVSSRSDAVRSRAVPVRAMGRAPPDVDVAGDSLEALGRRFVDAQNAGDAEACVEMLVPDDAEDGPARAYGAEGTAAIRVTIRAHLDAHPGLRYRTSGWRAFTTPDGEPAVSFAFTRACDDPTKRGAGTETLIFDAAARRVKRVEVTY